MAARSWDPWSICPAWRRHDAGPGLSTQSSMTDAVASGGDAVAELFGPVGGSIESGYPDGDSDR